MAQPRSIWPALLLLGAIAVLVYAATSPGWRGGVTSWQAAVPPATRDQAVLRAPARVCVTRFTLCPTAPARAGDPCSCPHPLRGLVPGHVETVGTAPRRPGGRHWPDRQDPRDVYDWDALVAP
jgi:hypothetical protein